MFQSQICQFAWNLDKPARPVSVGATSFLQHCLIFRCAAPVWTFAADIKMAMGVPPLTLAPLE